MKTVSREKGTVKSVLTDEFEQFIKKQHALTTVNGSKIKKFSWYKSALGFSA